MVAGEIVRTGAGQITRLGFNGRHPEAEAWTKTAGSKLVTEIVADQLTGIQSYISESIAAGSNPRSTALEIVGRLNRATGKREGGIIGLTSQQMGWVQNARAELADPAKMANYFTRESRDLQFDSMVRKALSEGRALSKADIDKITGVMSERLLKYRGEVIARTEALNALRAGRHETWRQAIERGTLNASDVIVEWSATMDKRTRHSHMVLDGQKVTFGKAFKSELGSLMEYPGDTTHGAVAADIIQCRCMAVYRRRRRGDA